MFVRILSVFLIFAVGLGAYISLCRPCLFTEIKITAPPISDPTSALTLIEQSEARFTNLRRGTQKEIIWFSDPPQKTNYAIVYVHGFTASKQELRPVPDFLAKSLEANLYYARLAGHGLPAEALGKVKVNDWLNDVVEAANIGRAIGRKVILIGASTGGSLITWLAAKPEYSKNIAAIVFVSPNYGLHPPASQVLRLPFSSSLVPFLLGPTRKFKPVNEEHKYWWTSVYPTQALVPMAQAVDLANAANVEKLKIPAYFVFSPRDKVVSGKATLNMIKRWGGPSQGLIVHTLDNPGNHVPAGRVLSPSTTELVSNNISQWLSDTLKPQSLTRP